MGFASTLRRYHTALLVDQARAMLWRIERAVHQVHARFEDIEALVPDGCVARSIVTDLTSIPVRVDPVPVGRAVEHLVGNAV